MNYDHIGVVNNELPVYNRGNLVGMGVNIYKITRLCHIRMFSFEGFQINCQRSRHVNAPSYSACTFDNIAINSTLYIVFLTFLSTTTPK